MVEHPTITMTRLTGYPQNEPDLYGKCINCGIEIFNGEDVFIAADYNYCSLVCFADLSLSEGNIERVVAGE